MIENTARLLRAALLCASFASVAGCAPANRQAGPPTPNPVNAADIAPRIIGTLDYGLLPEASGMAASRRHADSLWLVNDQGNRAELVALSTPTMSAKAIAVSGATNRDWEDLAAFTLDRQHWLLIADVGDNNAVRNSVRLYFVPEPALDADRTDPALALNFRYEDGPRDVEAVAVDADRDAIFLLSKRTTPPVLYRLGLRRSLALARTGKAAVATRLGPIDSIPAPTALELRLFPKFGKYRNQPTGMDLSSDGAEIALLTYGEAYRIALAPGQSWLDALNQPLRGIGMPVLAQPETIAWDADGGLIVSSEQRAAPLVYWPPR